MLYVKKRIPVEAFRYGIEEKPEWFLDAVADSMISIKNEIYDEDGNLSEESFCSVLTLEGEMICNYGNYIIRGIRGELYPCDYEIFKLTYEPFEN